MTKCHNFGFEYLQGMSKVIAGEMEPACGKMICTLAQDWANFMQTTMPHSGTRIPRWANMVG